MADLSQEEKLARAAAALARAEGVAAVRETSPPSDGPVFGPSASGPARRGRRRTRPAGGAKSSPPPEDPQSVRADADPEAVARAIVLRQLGMAPRSRAQLEKKLRERGCDDDVAKRVLDRMTEVGLVDDEAYAEMLVRSKQASRGLARRALAHELHKHGIDDDLAQEALGDVGAAQERAKAEELVAKKLRTMHGLPPDVQARRLAGMLARKGYPGDIAWPVVRDAVNDSVERHRD
jgi:regulatory protein